MILSRFSKVRLGQGQERVTDRPGGSGIQGCHSPPEPRKKWGLFFGIVKGSWWFSWSLKNALLLWGGGWKALWGYTLRFQQIFVTWAWGVFNSWCFFSPWGAKLSQSAMDQGPSGSGAWRVFFDGRREFLQVLDRPAFHRWPGRIVKSVPLKEAAALSCRCFFFWGGGWGA